MKAERAILAAEQLAAAVREAEGAFPAECCGLLLGRRTPNGWNLERLHTMRNASAQPERGFEFDAREQLHAYREADAAGLEILGNYHSHPNARRGPSPVRPSRSARFAW